MDSGAAQLRQGQRAGGRARRQLLIQILQDLHLETVKDRYFFVLLALKTQQKDTHVPAERNADSEMLECVQR